MYVDLDLFKQTVLEIVMPSKDDPGFVNIVRRKIAIAEECDLDEDDPVVLAYAFQAYALDEAIASVEFDKNKFRYIWP